MKSINYLFILLFNCFAIPSVAQLMKLDSVLSTIEKNNPMLRMYDEQINAIDNYSQMAKGWMPPTFSTGPWQAPYNSFTDGMWMITGEQMIPNPAKQNANFKFMKGMSPVEAQSKAAKQNEMFAMAKQSYFGWVVLQHKYNVALQTDTLLNLIINLAQIRYTYNKEKLNNIYKAQADLYELRNMETMLLSDMKMFNIELNTLMNIDKSAIYTIDTTLTAHNYELQLTDTSQFASSRSDIKKYDEQLNYLQLQKKFEESKRLPEFGVSLSHMQSLGMMPNQFSAMGMISIPIVPWASREYKSGIKGINYTSNSVSFQKQALINETAGKLAALKTQIKSTKEQLANYNDKILPAYYKSYQTSLEAYNQNTEDLYIVLDALRMYRMARMNELEQLNKLLKLQIDYEMEMQIR